MYSGADGATTRRTCSLWDGLEARMGCLCVSRHSLRVRVTPVHFFISKKINRSGLEPVFATLCLKNGGAAIGAGMAWERKRRQRLVRGGFI